MAKTPLHDCNYAICPIATYNYEPIRPSWGGGGFWGASPKFKIDYQRMSNETSIAAVEEPQNPRCDREPAKLATLMTYSFHCYRCYYMRLTTRLYTKILQMWVEMRIFAPIITTAPQSSCRAARRPALMACRPSFCTAQASAGSLTSPWCFSTAFWYCRHA